jgi:hypothetical protein
MQFKQLLTFQDVANELGCDDDTVRSLVVEERSLPAIVVTQVGYKEPYSELQLLLVGVQGMVFDFQNSNNHIGYLRVQRCDLDTFKAQHSASLQTPAAPTSARWPAHETKKLTALRLAAVKFWSNYDPAQPDTAPKNETVVDWLQREHGIGATPAAEMASILRPESLRTGPR